MELTSRQGKIQEPSGTMLQSSRIATLVLTKFGIDGIIMIAKSRKFKANDQHTMTMDNVPLVLPTSVCKGVRTLDVGIAAAEEAGLSVSAALLASRAPDSLLYMTLRHYHILPPSLARVPRIGHAFLRAWWSEMYSEILETMGPRGGGYGLLLELFETPLVFEACDRARLVELFDSIGIIVAEPYEKRGVCIKIGDDDIGVVDSDYGFLQTLFLVDNWDTVHGGGMDTARLKLVK